MIPQLLVAGLSLVAIQPALAATVPVEVLQKRAVNDVNARINAIIASGANRTGYQDILQELNQLKPLVTPSTIEDIFTAVANVRATAPKNIFNKAAALISQGITPGNLTETIRGLDSGYNSYNNQNAPPPQPVYPKKGPNDAPYDISEEQLRAAIVIPPTFTYGQKPPVILVPGTGSTGFLTYSGNFLKTLTGKPFADPVWLNIPHFLLDDAQGNAEYVAYAINYINSLTSGKNVSVIAWSQGNLDTQWAFKYWPSTRAVTSDLISISPDFHGTMFASFLCPALAPLVCTPAVYQQQYLANFIEKLRSHGGDSAYVPTTSIFSKTDEIVFPQALPVASAEIYDERRVGVSNTEVQLACPLMPAGGLYTHEGLLANALAYELAVDALTHDGPGELSRINKLKTCMMKEAPGLGPEDIIATEASIIIAAITILLYEPKELTEPTLKPYAFTLGRS